MAKIKFNGLVGEVRGSIGDVVVRKYKNKIILSNKPSRSNNAATEAQTAHQKRFNKAVAFGKRVMADETLRPLYQEAAKNKDVPIFSICIADYFNAPSIDLIEVDTYIGRFGNPIKITTTDDVGVVKVTVKLFDGQGILIESGEAKETATNTGSWVYTATETVDAGTTVRIDVTAMDHPGGLAVLSTSKQI